MTVFADEIHVFRNCGPALGEIRNRGRLLERFVATRVLQEDHSPRAQHRLFPFYCHNRIDFFNHPVRMLNDFLVHGSQQFVLVAVPLCHRRFQLGFVSTGEAGQTLNHRYGDNGRLEKHPLGRCVCRWDFVLFGGHLDVVALYFKQTHNFVFLGQLGFDDVGDHCCVVQRGLVRFIDALPRFHGLAFHRIHNTADICHTRCVASDIQGIASQTVFTPGE